MTLLTPLWQLLKTLPLHGQDAQPRYVMIVRQRLDVNWFAHIWTIDCPSKEDAFWERSDYLDQKEVEGFETRVIDDELAVYFHRERAEYFEIRTEPS